MAWCVNIDPGIAWGALKAIDDQLTGSSGYQSSETSCVSGSLLCATLAPSSAGLVCLRLFVAICAWCLCCLSVGLACPVCLSFCISKRCHFDSLLYGSLAPCICVCLSVSPYGCLCVCLLISSFLAITDAVTNLKIKCKINKFKPQPICKFNMQQ